jgi:peptide/nickel transport system substrate-binding protein
MCKQSRQKQIIFQALAVILGIFLVLTAGSALAGGKPGAPVDGMTITTATATMDPVRPEAARVIAAAFQSLGWDVTASPIDYNQNVQKVIMEHDYDMWLVMLSGASLRIDPNIFIYKKHFSGTGKVSMSPKSMLWRKPSKKRWTSIRERISYTKLRN